ncbi:MAG TPA: YceI family protein [Bacteroidetes bacterium]|nr:YceI family protein [Bacteroidota bacterium]
MKKLLFLLSLAAGLFTACQTNTGNAEAAKTTEAKETASASSAAINYHVDTAQSVVYWEGYKPGKYGHRGTMKLQSGTIAAKNGVPESGEFIINVASLENIDLAENPEKKAKLEGHLKSADFFDVATYPAGKFVMTGIAPLEGNPKANYTVKGNLTLKDITKGIEIPAHISLNNGTLVVTTPEFTINRTDWGVNYGSGIIGTIKDKMIADDVKLKINLVATAAAN